MASWDSEVSIVCTLSEYCEFGHGALTNKVFKSVKKTKHNGDIINFEVLLSVNNDIVVFIIN